MTDDVRSTRWERDEGGHLSDAALSAMADAQAVSASSVAHVESCAACSDRLADSALRSSALHRQIGELSPEHVTALGRAEVPSRERPWPYIAAALVVGLLASAPTLGTLPQRLMTLAAAVKLQAAGFRQVGRALFEALSGPVSSLLFAAILVAVGVAIAVWGTKSKERRSNHGFA